MNWMLAPAVLAYAATVYALCFAVFVVARRAAVRRMPATLDLLVVMLGYFAVNSMIIQWLGVCHQLEAPQYVLVCTALGLVATLGFGGVSAHRRFVQVLSNGISLCLWQIPLRLGILFVAFAAVLAYHACLVVETDSVADGLPLMVRWLQSGEIDLANMGNYARCWEHQYFPGLLFTRSDVLLIVPGLLQAFCVLLAVRELCRCLRLSPLSSTLLAWLCVLTPMVWIGNTGANSIKNDIAFGLGLVSLFIVLIYLSKRQNGVFLLGQFAVYLLLGTKPSGPVVVLLMMPVIVVLALRSATAPLRQRAQTAVFWLAVTFVIQSAPAAVYAVNYSHYGNPVYPVQIWFNGRLVLDGFRDLRGTSILSHWSDVGSWIAWFKGATRRVGIEFPWLLLLLVVAGVHAGVVRMRGRKHRQGAKSRLCQGEGLCIVLTMVLWVLYACTYWTRGHTAQDEVYLFNGYSLRYAFGQLCVTYVIGCAFLTRLLGGRRMFWGLCALIPVLLYHKWLPLGSLWYGHENISWAASSLVATWIAVGWITRAGGYVRGLPLWQNRGPRVVIGIMALSIGTVAVVGYGRMVEMRRQRDWFPEYSDIWRYIWLYCPSNTRIAMNEGARLRYPLLGPRLSNQLSILETTDEAVVVPEGTDLVFLQHQNERRAEQLRKLGWEEVAHSSDGKAMLFAPRRASDRARIGKQNASGDSE